jgi:hypothetical protein
MKNRLSCFPRSTALIVTIVIVLVVFGIVWIFPLPTVTPPPEYTDANLQIDVKIENWANTELNVAGISCPIFDSVTDDSKQFPMWYQHWCKTEALNIPLKLDHDGKGTLWFSVRPRPHKADISNETLGSPGVGLKYQNGASGSYKPDIISPDHWYVHVAK